MLECQTFWQIQMAATFSRFGVCAFGKSRILSTAVLKDAPSAIANCSLDVFAVVFRTTIGAVASTHCQLSVTHECRIQQTYSKP